MKYQIEVPDDFSLDDLCKVEDEVEAIQKRIDASVMAKRVASLYESQVKRAREAVDGGVFSSVVIAIGRIMIREEAGETHFGDLLAALVAEAEAITGERIGPWNHPAPEFFQASSRELLIQLGRVDDPGIGAVVKRVALTASDWLVWETENRLKSGTSRSDVGTQGES